MKIVLAYRMKISALATLKHLRQKLSVICSIWKFSFLYVLRTIVLRHIYLGMKLEVLILKKHNINDDALYFLFKINNFK
jgi:hypothetical protein